MDHVNFVLTVTIGVLSSVIGFLFDVPGSALLAILGGALMGAAIKRPVGFMEGVAIVLATTTLLAWVLPMITTDPVYLKGIGVLTALVATGGRALVPGGIEKVFNAGVDEVIGVIKATGSVIKRRLGSKEEPTE